MSDSIATRDEPSFRNVDWSELDGRRRWSPSPSTWFAGVGLGAVALAFGYDYVARPGGAPLFGTWDPPIVDWLFASVPVIVALDYAGFFRGVFMS